MKQLYRVVVFLIFLIPGFVWSRQTGDLSVYLRGDVPDGQLLYVISKLVGMYALTTLVWQIVSTLAVKLKLVDATVFGSRHRLTGAIVVSLALLHALLFATAVSMRQGYPAFTLLLPDFRDYYHTQLSIGLFALGLLLVVVTAGVNRWIFSGWWPAIIHKVYWIAIGCAYWHALAIGSEAQTNFGLFFYGLLGFLCIGMLFLWLAKNKRSRAEDYK